MTETSKAARKDLDAICALLEANRLPALPGEIPLSNVLVVLGDGSVVGAIALEVACRRGLLHSAVVAPSHQGKGIGTSLVASLVARAHELGLRALYLVTGDASDFFARSGFSAVERTEVPREIQATRQYREQCSDSAAVMCLPLSTRL